MNCFMGTIIEAKVGWKIVGNWLKGSGKINFETKATFQRLDKSQWRGSSLHQVFSYIDFHFFCIKPPLGNYG